MANKLKTAFFHLLQIGLWGKLPPTSIKPLTDREWEHIYTFSITHTVECIIFDSFLFLDDTMLPPQYLRLKWAVRVDQVERQNTKMKIAIENQYKIFIENGLSPILQKGQGVAFCFNNPLHRISGDIDWYFEDRGYTKAREILKEKSIDFTDTAGFSLIYDWNGIDVEHHKNLFDIRSPLKASYLKKIEKHYQNNQLRINIGNTPIKILAPELQMLQVNGHILKHMISFGMGLRQFCDSAKLYSYYSEKIDKDLLKKIYKNAGILKWTHILHKILVDYIGLPPEQLPFNYPDKINVSWMLKEIWHGGNFGYYDDRYVGGKVNEKISIQPDGAKRLWANFWRYLPYAPQEVFFFPFVHLYSKFIGIDRS